MGGWDDVLILKHDKEPADETAHQQWLFVWAARAQATMPQLRWLFAVPNGGLRHPAVGGQLRAQGVKAGVSDVILPYPSRGYHGLYIEMKRPDPNARVTPDQREFLGAMQRAGNRAAVCFHWRLAAELIELYLKPDAPDPKGWFPCSSS